MVYFKVVKVEGRGENTDNCNWIKINLKKREKRSKELLSQEKHLFFVSIWDNRSIWVK